MIERNEDVPKLGVRVINTVHAGKLIGRTYDHARAIRPHQKEREAFTESWQKLMLPINCVSDNRKIFCSQSICRVPFLAIKAVSYQVFVFVSNAGSVGLHACRIGTDHLFSKTKTGRPAHHGQQKLLSLLLCTIVENGIKSAQRVVRRSIRRKSRGNGSQQY